jgi:PqqD family protein of HPr-rel-A system
MTVRYAAASGLRTLDFGDECIVFNPLSWDAHLLNAAAAAILEVLAERPQDLHEVESLLGELLTESERSQAGVHARRALDELAQLGLVRRLDDEPAAR